jgi:hypothetical protein
MGASNEGHTYKTFKGAGTHALTVKGFDTPYLVLAARMLVNAADPADIKAANALQDQFRMEATSAKPFRVPDFLTVSYNTTYSPCSNLARA